MHYTHNIDPVALGLGPIQIHWYGIMYLLAFACYYLLGKRRMAGIGWDERRLYDFLFWGIVGVIVGGRLGYVLFYQFGQLLNDPLFLLKIWQGGMSFHGGLIGSIVAASLFARKHKQSPWTILDFSAPLVAIGLGLGRVGNFIGGELWGRTTDVAWGVIFPLAGTEPRHPSQLYQAAAEGIVLFAVLWLYSSRKRPRMAVSGLFLIVYAAIRFGIEFVREPDRHLGYIAFDWLTMGQLLSLPMLAAGVVLMLWAYRRQAQPKPTSPN